MSDPDWIPRKLFGVQGTVFMDHGTMKSFQRTVLRRPHSDMPEDHFEAGYQYGDFRCLVSDNDRFDETDERWRHVSVSHRTRIPKYDELIVFRRSFFPSTALVLQVFPPETEHINLHPRCLHLWWNKDRRVCPAALAAGVG